jgi:hypothetical protein
VKTPEFLEIFRKIEIFENQHTQTTFDYELLSVSSRKYQYAFVTIYLKCITLQAEQGFRRCG